MNLVQFLAPQSRNIGSGGRLEGKENVKLVFINNTGVKVNSLKDERESENTDFQSVLLSVLTEVSDLKISDFKNLSLMIKNLKKLNLSEAELSKVLSIIDALKNSKENSAKDKLFTYLNLILSSDLSKETKKVLLNHTEFIQKLTNIFNSKEKAESFKNIQNITLDTLSDEEKDELIQKISEILQNSEDIKFSDVISINETNESEKNLENDEMKNLSKKHLNFSETLKIVRPFSEKSIEGDENVISKSETNSDSTVDLKNFSETAEKLKKLIGSENEVIEIENASSSQNDVVQKNISHIASTLIDQNISEGVRTTKLKSIENANVTNVKVSNTGKVYLRTSINNVSVSSKTVTNSDVFKIRSSEMEKMIRVFTDSKLKVIDFEKVKISVDGKTQIEKGHTMILSNEKKVANLTENGKMGIRINEKIQIDSAQKKYIPVRTNFTNVKDFMSIISEKTEDSSIKTEKAISSIATNENEGIAEVSDENDTSHGKSSLNEKISFSKSQLNDNNEIDSKILTVNREFSKEISNVVEKLVQKNQSISKDIGDTLITKPQVEIHRVVVKLHPPQLGELELTVVKNGKNIEINMGVASEIVKDTLEKNLTHLDQRLRELGFNLEKLNFEVREQSLKAFENQLEDNQNQGKNYQENQHQNHENRRGYDEQNKKEFFEEIFEKEVMENDEQRV